MALGILDLKEGPKDAGFFEDLKVHIAEVTGDATYAAGGYTLAAGDFEMAAIVAVIPIAGTGAVVPVWNRSTGKLQFFKTGTAVNTGTGTGGLSEASTNDTLVSGAKAVLLVVGTPN